MRIVKFFFLFQILELTVTSSCEITHVIRLLMGGWIVWHKGSWKFVIFQHVRVGLMLRGASVAIFYVMDSEDIAQSGMSVWPNLDVFSPTGHEPYIDCVSELDEV